MESTDESEHREMTAHYVIFSHLHELNREIGESKFEHVMA